LYPVRPIRKGEENNGYAGVEPRLAGIFGDRRRPTSEDLTKTGSVHKEMLGMRCSTYVGWNRKQLRYGHIVSEASNGAESAWCDTRHGYLRVYDRAFDGSISLHMRMRMWDTHGKNRVIPYTTYQLVNEVHFRGASILTGSDD
jgi:hypothetical protein